MRLNINLKKSRRSKNSRRRIKRTRKSRRYDGGDPDYYDDDKNIADYLNLPIYFSHMVRDSKLLYNDNMYTKLVELYEGGFGEYNETRDKQFIQNNIKNLVDLTMKSVYKDDKQLISLFLFNLLSTDKYAGFTNSLPTFKQTVDSKIKEFSNDTETDYIFSAYIKDTFETGKYYLLKSKN